MHTFNFVAAILASATSSLAQMTTSAPSISDAATDITALLVLDSSAANTGYVASIISANSCNTTAYVLECAETDSPNPLCLTVPSASITVTARPDNYDFIWSSYNAGAVGTVTQTCDLEGPSPDFTRAVCTLSAWIGARGQSVQITSTVETLEGTALPSVETIPVTAGVENTATGCEVDALPSRTSSTSNGVVGGGPTVPATTSVSSGVRREVRLDGVVQKVSVAVAVGFVGVLVV